MKNQSEYTIPEFITEIGTDAFLEASELTELTIPSRVISIGRDAIPEHVNVIWPNIYSENHWSGGTEITGCDIRVRELFIPAKLNGKTVISVFVNAERWI